MNGNSWLVTYVKQFANYRSRCLRDRTFYSLTGLCAQPSTRGATGLSLVTSHDLPLSLAPHNLQITNHKTSPMNDTVPTELIEFARRMAGSQGLEPALVCAVIEQESSWNTWAVRYEPGFLARYVAPLYTAGKFSATEAYMRSMSWGLMQVMGQSAREAGFAEQSLAELCDPSIGLQYGCRILAKHIARGKGDVSAALLAWNGGATLNYADIVLARKRNYSLKSVK